MRPPISQTQEGADAIDWFPVPESRTGRDSVVGNRSVGETPESGMKTVLVSLLIQERPRLALPRLAPGTTPLAPFRPRLAS